MADKLFIRQPSPRIKLASKQQGMMLIVLVFLVGLAATAFIIHALNGNTVRNEQAKKSSQTLVDAKALLIGYTLDRVSSGERPGDMPYPDRLLMPTESPPAGGPSNYDGNADSCVITGTGTLTKWYCLGRLPWATLGMSIDLPSENDSDGRMPWYAVSANLLDVCLNELNPGILDYNYSNTYPAGCPGTPVSGTLPHPWLTVRDKYGNVVSNRVAVVLIIPGPVIGAQARPPSPNLASASEYLDTLTISSSCTATITCVPGTYNNDNLDNDFIMGDDSRYVADCDPIYRGSDCQTAYNFNDRLVYITIDELMAEIVKRAAGEARAILAGYKAKNSQFPDAALLGSSGTYSPVASNDAGMLPINLGACSCASSTSCTCSFSLLTNTSFKRAGASTWNALNINGACTRPTSQTCTCTGAGWCKNTSLSRTFECYSTGNCTVTAGTSGQYIFTPATYGKVTTTTGDCSKSGNNAACTIITSGSFSIDLNFPSWFTSNLWQDYFYYHRSTSSSLQVGTQGNIQALVIGASAPVVSAPFASKGSAQARPSGNIAEYLDSAENTDGDLLFDSTNEPRSSSYNDQVFIVAP